MLSQIKRYAGLTISLLFAFSLCACVPVFSIHPLYTDKDLYFEPALVGTWFDPSGSVQPITFARRGSNSYVVTAVDDSVPPVKYTYDAHVVKLSGRLFIDAQQSDISTANGSILILAAPAHMLGEVAFDQQTLTIRFLDDDWTRSALRGGGVAIRHDTSDDGTPILTATTADLQNFILTHADDTKAFSVVLGPLRRKK